MKGKGKAIKAAAVSMAIMLGTSTAFAADFKDVPKTYWAYDAINAITSQGLMVGDMSGNFNPEAYIDKFDTAKVLAKVLGYDYNNASDQDKAYYDKLYNDKKAFLKQFEKAFAKWNLTADREIAFLMEKGVIKDEDLNQFVIKDTNGKEYLRALSREEAAVFLVRVMGKSSEAASYKITTKFSDDASINSAKKQAVYYLKSLGIVNGTTDGKFNPNKAVTREDFCVLLNNALKLMGKTVTVDTSLKQNTTTNNSGAVVNNIETVVGTLDKYFSSLNVIQINTGSVQKLYKVSSGAAIKVDGFNSSLADLKEGMKITAVTNNSEIVQIDAQKTTTDTVTIPTTEAVTETTTSSEIVIDGSNSIVETTTANSNNTITATVSESDLTVIVGTVEEINGNKITLNYRMVNSRDEINTQKKTYTIANDAMITRNATVVSAEDIKVNDIASAKILGSTIYNLELEGESLNINGGKLVKKYYNKAKSMPALVIEASNGKSYELFVDEDSQLARNIDDETDWSDLKIGDSVNVRAKLNKIESLNAKGEEKNIEGYITEIRIGEDTSYVGFSADENSGTKTLYTVDEDSVDLYSLHLGDKVKMYLDSEEVEAINVKKSTESKSLTGYITSVKSDYIYVEVSKEGSTAKKKVEYDKDTVILNSVSGKKLKAKDLDEDMKVYVVLDSSEDKLAKTITVLSNN